MGQSLDLSRGWRTARVTDDRASRTAESELNRVLTQLTGVGIEPGGDAPVMRLGHRGGDSDGFRWSVDQDGLSIEGEGPRGLLFGVYDLLESVGCWWPSPGSEVLPAGAPVAAIPTGSREDGPALPGRALII